VKTISLSLRDTYRATDVHRWQIVKTQRQQSVAEHSFQVALITSKLCDKFGVAEAVRCKAVWHALVHDLPEVLTGDLSTPLKRMLGPGAMSKLKDFENSLLVADRPVDLGDSLEAQTIQEIVKVADLIEAVAFLNLNNTTTHGKDIEARIKTEVKRRGGDVAEEIMKEILYADEVTLDDIMSGD